MSVQDINRMSCTHALCEPGDGQKVNTSPLSLGVQPPSHLLTAVVFRHDMRYTLTEKREYESTTKDGFVVRSHKLCRITRGVLKLSNSTVVMVTMMLVLRLSYLNTSSMWKPFFLPSWERKLLRLAPIFFSRRNKTTSGNLMKCVSSPPVAAALSAGGQAIFLRFNGTMVPGVEHSIHSALMHCDAIHQWFRCIDSIWLYCHTSTSRSFLANSSGYFDSYRNNLKCE